MERGECNVGLVIIAKLAKALDVSPRLLLP